VGYTVSFSAEDAVDRALAGGKGANLARLAAGGFDVPPGFIVTTDAYRAFLEHDGLKERAAKELASLRTGDAGSAEAVTAGIRDLITSAEIPAAIAEAIVAGYTELDPNDAHVAVRSSGTAEDLAEASFAGLYDTYLDIRGEQKVLDAVRRCWASLWTARATAYRSDMGFDQLEAALGVVVQTMMPADVAGVMFTANPLTGAVDETVINASWGLGEAVVSGIVNPDEFAVYRETGRVRRRQIATKQVQVVRADSGHGTVEVPVSPEKQDAPSLTDAQAIELAVLGRKVTAHYEGFPQDIEWALADGRFHVLQARPITGVELSWDEDLELFHLGEEPEGAIYTRAWSDDFSIAAITPLYYTTRSKEWSDCYRTSQQLMGHADVAAIRSWKYHKGEAYFSTDMEAAWTKKILPQNLRAGGALNKIPPSRWQEVQEAPFSWFDYARVFARIELLDGRSGAYRYVKSFKERIDRPEARGLSDEELAALTDAEFERHLRYRLDLWKAADDDQWQAFFLYAPFAMGTLADMLVRWYDGDIGQAFTDLLSGLTQRSITLRENHEIWEFGQRIRNSDVLRRLLDEHQGAAFFEALAGHPEGREFLDDYEPWRIKRGHRGAEDRDFSLPRRVDDPMIDYNSFKALMAGDSADPLQQAEQLRAKREQRERDVYPQIERQPLGFLKLQAFRLLQQWSLTFIAHRDDEREYLDLLAYAQRRCFLEMGRRLHARGQIDAVDDVFFLGLEENLDLLHGRASERLCRAKIEGRKRNFLRRQRMEATLPNYIAADGTPALPGELIGMVAAETHSEEGRTILPGVGTSGGIVTGRARVLKNMSEIGTLERGDILVCHATDPGWTPVFMVIGGLVMQTGGVLAHGSCLSREYGLPAVVVPDAINRIEDGSMITLNGDLGRVEIAPDSAPAPAALEAVAG